METISWQVPKQPTMEELGELTHSIELIKQFMGSGELNLESVINRIQEEIIKKVLLGNARLDLKLVIYRLQEILEEVSRYGHIYDNYLGYNPDDVGKKYDPGYDPEWPDSPANDNT